MSLSTVKGGLLLLGWSELLPQVKEFKYLGVLFMSEDKLEVDRWISAASATMWALWQTAVVKNEQVHCSHV